MKSGGPYQLAKSNQDPKDKKPLFQSYEMRAALNARERRNRKASLQREIHTANHAKSGGQARTKEEWLVEAMDNKGKLLKLADIFEKLSQNKIDIVTAFGSVSPAMFLEMTQIAVSGESEKNRLDAAKHLLALAGHTPTQRHEIGRLDPNTPKEALISLIAGAKKDLGDVGIEIVDDDEDQTE